MKIILYNHYHNGDLFLNQPIVRNICFNNPLHCFTMVCKYNTYIFKDIPGLYIDSFNNNLYLNEHITNMFGRLDENTIFINLWVGPLINDTLSDIPLNRIECNIKSYVTNFKKILELIYDTLNINLCIDDFNQYSYLPIIPAVDISDFINWFNLKENKHLVFYYNYLPKSFQTIPISSHNKLITDLAVKFTNKIFIIPKITPELSILINNIGLTNIMCCSKDFNCPETVSCENLCKVERIAEMCGYSIHFDIGACFYYVNSLRAYSNTQSIHISVNNKYYNNLLEHFPQIAKKITFMEASIQDIVYLKLVDIFTNNEH
jgi:hypothetical protein